MQQCAVTPLDVGRLSAFVPIDPALPAGPQVFQTLRTAILGMVLVPGQVLSEPEIGACLGVSRTPVREAFAQLRAMNLVETLPSRGSYVTKLNAAKIREAQFLREALEKANVQRLVETGLTPNLTSAFDANLKAQEFAIVKGDHQRFHDLDDDFHSLIASATGFPRAAIVLSHEKTQLDRLRMIALRDGGRFDALFAEHTALIAAIKAQDVDTALSVAQTHLRSVLTTLATVAAANTAFFDP
jgi:DNA-binding GntR family transcriptional regulator